MLLKGIAYDYFLVRMKRAISTLIFKKFLNANGLDVKLVKNKEVVKAIYSS
jgi:hypothetical protein